MAEVTEQQRQKVEELTLECLANGTSMGAIKGYSKDEIEAVYNVAHNLYQQHQYEDAGKLFSFLTLYEHADGRFALGLGGCYQLLGEYDKAIIAYSCAAIIDATNPMSAFHAGECYIALKDWENAAKAIVAVETICEVTADEVDRTEFLKQVEAMSKIVDEHSRPS